MVGVYVSKLLLSTHSKSHRASFPLDQKSVILNKHERRNNRYFVLSRRNWDFVPLTHSG